MKWRYYLAILEAINEWNFSKVICMFVQDVGAGRAAGVPAVGDGGAELAQREGAGGAGARLGRPAHQPARRAALLRGTPPPTVPHSLTVTLDKLVYRPIVASKNR